MQIRRLLPISVVFCAGCSNMTAIEQYAHLPAESVGTISVSCWTYSTFERRMGRNGSVLVAASAVNQAAASLCSEDSLADLPPVVSDIRYGAAARNFLRKKGENCLLVSGRELTPLHSEFEFLCT